MKSAIAELKEAKAHGVDTIVDLTVMGLGRDVKTVRDIAQASGMRVIVATGLYTYDVLPHHFESRDADYMAAQFVADIEDGIQGTDIRAGILKCATDEPGVTTGVEKVLRAVARAHRQTACLSRPTRTPPRSAASSSRTSSSRRASTFAASSSDTAATARTSTTSRR